MLIIWVDDDIELLTSDIRMLERENIPCVGFSHPQEAIEYFKKGGNTPTAMITDYNMPGMNGVELAQKVREILPNLPILFCSGSYNKEMSTVKNSLAISKCCTADKVIDDINYLLEKYNVEH